MAIETAVSYGYREARELIGTEAERATMTTGQKAELPALSTFWAYDTKKGYVIAAGDWREI